MRTAAVRAEVQRLLRQTPFRPFVLNKENGDRLTVEHPENVAFVPDEEDSGDGSTDFYLITSRLRFFGTFEAVTSVAIQDTGQPANT